MKKFIRARLNNPSMVELDQDGGLPTEDKVFPIGKYKTYIGEFNFTDAIFAEMTANFKKGVPNAVPINFDHNKDRRKGVATPPRHFKETCI